MSSPVHPINWCIKQGGFLTNNKSTCYAPCHHYVHRNTIMDQPIPKSFFDKSCFAKGREGLPLPAEDAAVDVVACEQKYKTPGISWDTLKDKVRCVEFAMPDMKGNKTPSYKPVDAQQISKNDRKVNNFLYQTYSFLDEKQGDLVKLDGEFPDPDPDDVPVINIIDELKQCVIKKIRK